MKSATQVLREEHDVILEMLDALDAIAHRVETGNEVSLQVLTDLHEFFVLFADRLHHEKEEDLLFPFLERKGVPRAGGPLGRMLKEHEEGRAFVKTMATNAQGCADREESARKSWLTAARGYANLLRNHIWKENEVLFQIAERLISPDEQTMLAKEFAKVEGEKLAPESRTELKQKMESLLREIAATAN